MFGIDQDAIADAVARMLTVNMGLKPRESLLVVSDYPNEEQWAKGSAETVAQICRRALLGRAVAEIARQRFPDCPVTFLPFPATGRSGVEPPEAVAEAMAQAQVIVAITSYSLSHTDARQNACRNGARVASMPRFLPEMFEPGGPMDVDYVDVERQTRILANLLTDASEVHITSPAGTDLRFSIAGRPGQVDAGIYHKPGSWGNLPAGEAYCAPVEGTAEGQIVVVPGWFAGLQHPMTLRIRHGELVAIEGGGEVGDNLHHLLHPEIGVSPYRERRNLGEFGIGTNPNARRIDITLEAEKIMGTVHCALGDNSHMGGTVTADYHQDFIIPEASVELDGQLIMEQGRWLVVT
ncbi:MAG: aminopeptidase [Anaerolineae bacterium]